MRVLLIRPGPNFSVADVARGWVKGLGLNGCHVADFNFDDRLSFYESASVPDGDGNLVKAFDVQGAVRLANQSLLSVVYSYWPDVVVIVSGFYIAPDVFGLLRDRGHKIVMLHTESPYEDDKQLERAQLCDVNVLNDPTNIDRFPAGTMYLPHAYDPDVHKPTGDVGPYSDLAMVGTGYPSRIEFLERVDWSGLEVILAGNWDALSEDSPLLPFLAHARDECLPNDQAANLYRAAKASANLYRRETTEGGGADGWAMGPREVELAATGCFYLTEPRGENREVLPMVPTFSDPDDFGEQLRWWLTHDRERDRVVGHARAAIADRTFENHAKRLLEAL